MIVKANAKINLTLDIVGKRDDGFHLLDSVFQSVSLFDEIEIKESENISVAFSDSQVDGKTSLAMKAAKAFFEYTKIKSGAEISIKSNIPTCSGMGGGSSDCAGVLVGLNRLFGTSLSLNALCKIGATLGSDVPFCIVGATARVRGVGEIVEPLPDIQKLNLLIIKHSQKLSTADMYNKIDSRQFISPKTENMVKAIKNNDISEILNNISNAFLSVADISFEEKLLKECGALKAGLSGSGPSVFGIFPDTHTSDTAFKTLKNAGYTVFLAQTSEKGIIIE